MTLPANLFADIAASAAQEQFSDLLNHPGLRIERIVSSGQCSPADFWYDQDGGEWILLVAGEAGLRFDDEPDARHLKPGDFLDIAPHRRHRIEWTSSDQPTIWLAIHYGPE